MTKIPEPHDRVGNILAKDNWVAILDQTILGKIIALEAGGIHTANGITPATVRVVAEITFRLLPGVPFFHLVRIVEPQAQAVIEGLADALPRA